MGLRGSTGKHSRVSVGEKAKKFGDLAGRVDLAGIKKLGESDPKAAYIATQQLEQQLLQEEAAHNAQAAELAQQLDGKPKDEVEAEMELKMEAQLPFQKKHQLQNVQELKMEIENQLRSRHISTPKPGA